MIENGTKMWNVSYDHKDGRSGVVKVETEVFDSGAFAYGNGKGGCITVDDFEQGYDLRYVHDDDLHMAMIREFFGKGLIKATPC